MRKSIETKNITNANGPYSQVLKVGDNIYVSGITAVNESNLNSFEDQATLIFKNLDELFDQLKLDLDYVVKTNVFVTRDVDLKQLDEVYAKYFNAPYPARTVAIIDELPVAGAKIQIGLDAIDLSAFRAMNECDEPGCNDCEDDSCSYN